MNELYKKRNELLYKSKKLREVSKDDNLTYEQTIELRNKQQDAYNRTMFYSNLIKAVNRRSNNVRERDL